MTLLKDILLSQMGFSNEDLAGETAIVTGGGRGIGRELAILLSRLGAKVVIAEISPEGQVIADAIAAEGGQGIAIATDVSSEASVQDMLSECRSRFGEPTILVNNAIYCPVKPLAEMTAGEWDKVISVNLRGAFLLIRGVLPAMIKLRRGVVVNMISAPSMPYLAAYAATKQALESLAHSLAGEVEGSGVSVIAYGPGMVDTEGGVDAFRTLSSYLGIPYDQMVHSGLNPGYGGLVPAYDAALSLAYIICHAREYNNQTVAMHEPLHKFVPVDILRESDRSREPGPSTKVPSTPAPVFSPAEETVIEKCLRGSQVALRLATMVKETDAEFDKLPFFARPMARGGLKKKAGMAISDIALMVGSLGVFLKEIAGSSGDDAAGQDHSSWDSTLRQFAAKWPNAERVLQGLSVYYSEVVSETGRFIKDRDALAEIAKTSSERENTAKELADLIVELLAV